MYTYNVHVNVVPGFDLRLAWIHEFLYKCDVQRLQPLFGPGDMAENNLEKVCSKVDGMPLWFWNAFFLPKALAFARSKRVFMHVQVQVVNVLINGEISSVGETSARIHPDGYLVSVATPFWMAPSNAFFDYLRDASLGNLVERVSPAGSRTMIVTVVTIITTLVAPVTVIEVNILLFLFEKKDGIE